MYRVDHIAKSYNEKGYYFLSLNYALNLVLVIEPQNQKSLAIQLSIPFIFNHPSPPATSRSPPCLTQKRKRERREKEREIGSDT